jgi:hypothetical protein
VIVCSAAPVHAEISSAAPASYFPPGTAMHHFWLSVESSDWNVWYCVSAGSCAGSS